MATGRTGPEASPIVNSYRRLIPSGVRFHVNRRLPIGLRYRVKKLLYAVVKVFLSVGTLRHRIRTLIRPSFYRGPATSEAEVNGKRRVALVHDRLTALTAREFNQAAVVCALDGAGIDYFAVRGTSDSHSVIGVSETDRATALTAVQSLAVASSAYVSVLYGERAVVAEPVRPAIEKAPWRQAKTASAVRVTWFRTDPTRKIVFGSAYGCEVEFWAPKDDVLVGPRRNRVTDKIRLDSPAVEAPGAIFTRLASFEDRSLAVVRTREAFTHLRPDDISFPIDAVFTWVDGSDPAWMKRRSTAMGVPFHPDAANSARYLNRDELKYALRSVETFAPWIRHVYIVTDDQRPAWLAADTPGLTVVDHRDIFDDHSALPTFNSHAIETQLHHIDGLSEHFLYLNDDMMFGTDVVPQDFFQANGLTHFFESPANVPHGEIAEGDAPVTAAGKNNRAILRKRFGSHLTQKMKHTPYPLRRSILDEIEKEFPDELAATTSHRLRNAADISLLSSLYHYYAFLTARATPADISYTYIDLAKRDALRSLGLVSAHRDQQAFCLNSTSDVDDIKHEVLQNFLDSYFPIKSRYES